jgi:OOP family OmpA-OmpF porin
MRREKESVMAESLFASLLHGLDKGSISQIASILGESEHNVSRGMEASVASVLGAVVNKTEDPAALRGLVDLAPSNQGDPSWSKMAAGLSAPGASRISSGKELLLGIFGSDHAAVTNAIAIDSGVSTATAEHLLAMAAPMVLAGLGRRMREQGWSVRSLGAALLREGPTIRSALPVGVANLFWPGSASATMPGNVIPPPSSPVIGQSVQRDRASAAWLGALVLALAALGCFWLWSHARRSVERASIAPTGAANRLENDYVYRRLPSGLALNVPADGMEPRIIDTIDGTAGNQSTWIDFDRVQFDPGSARLNPVSSEQLDNIAAILNAYPTVHLNLAGNSESVGYARQNMELSRARADAVRGALVARGISPDRLTTEVSGGAASADNSTAAGRASNEGVSAQVTQR